MLNLTDQNFDTEISKINTPVVVDFWAEWCGPCSMFSPVLESLDKQFNGEVVFAKVNIDESPNTANQFKVDSIPSVFILKKQQILGGFRGFKKEEEVKSWIEEKIKE